MLGILLFVTVFLVPRPAASVFGELMMFVYYGYLLPLSARITRGLYADGVWTDSGFMAYADIGGSCLKGNDTLVPASRLKTTARHERAGHSSRRSPAFLRERSARTTSNLPGPAYTSVMDTRESV
jgi:hypothetical protein